MRLISKIINNQEKPVSNSGDSLGLPVTLTGNPLSFNKDTAGLASNTVITLEPIQAGTGDPSPSNVRAISGYDKVNVVVPRKNLWKYKDIEGTGWVYKNFDTFLPAGTYTISAVVTSSDTDTSTCLFTGIPVGETEAEGLIQMPRSSGGARVSGIFITSKPIYSLGFYAASYGLGGEGDTFSWKNIQIEEGSTATSYEPYNPATDLSIAMPGTVYGGTLDVESGELVVTHKSVDMGSLTWGYSDSTFTSSLPDGSFDSNIDFLCEIYKPDTSGANNTIAINRNNKIVYAHDSNYTTTSAFITAVTGKHIAYELATPITYHLTPHQVALLQGANVVTTNGTSISLTHRQGEIAAQADLVALAESVNAEDKGSVSVTRNNASETYGQILDRLGSIMDSSKISSNSKLFYITSNGYNIVLQAAVFGGSNDAFQFMLCTGSVNAIRVYAVILQSTGSTGGEAKYSFSGTSSYTDLTNAVFDYSAVELVY